MIKILHIIQQLSPGGAARGMIATAKYSSRSGNFQHIAMSLLPADIDALEMAREASITVLNNPDRNIIYKEIEKSDIVHINFWNTPEIYELLRSDLPAMRLLIWYHISGDGSPQIITQKLMDFADINIASNPNTFNNLPLLRDMLLDEKYKKVRMVYDAADFARLDDFKVRKHKNFNVGYIGTVDFVKMHRNYVSMSSVIDIPDVKFIVCGGGIENLLREEAQSLGVAERFDFRGYVNDIKSVIEILDVYGYPLCEDTYASAELNLQEVMYGGIPPVVFPYGGVKQLVVNDYTGYIVNSEVEYKKAVEYLYYHPEERERLGNNAKEYAKQIFGAENAAKKLNPIYEEMMREPKKLRLWGMKSDASLLYQPVTLEDLTGQINKPSGAELFIEALGDKGTDFITSMTSQNIHELFEAEKNIASSSPVLQSAGGGGIIHYRDYYPGDPYLKLWTGLVYQNNNNYSQAIPEFIEALNNISDNFRIAWYLAQTAEKAGNIKLAKEVLLGLIKINPSFSDARDMLARIDGDKKSSIYKEKILEAINTVNELRQMNLLDEAYSTLLDFIVKYNDSPDLLNLQAEINYQMGQIEEAKSLFLNLINRFPENSTILNNLGAILRSEGHIEEGMAYLVKAIRKNPDNRSATLNLADVLVTLKKYDEAKNFLSSYMERNPHDEDVRNILIQLQENFVGSLSSEPEQNSSEYIVNDIYLNRLKAFWNVDSMYEAMFKKVFVDDNIDRMTFDEKIKAWNKSAIGSANRILKDIPSEPSWNLLEIGCGVGRIIKPLRERFSIVDGVDIAENMIQFAREYLSNGKQNGDVYVNSGSDLSMLPDNFYDLVYSTIVFQHIRSLSVVMNYFKEIRRVLKPGGYFRLQVHEYTTELGKFNEEATSDREINFFGNGYKSEELNLLLVKSGFERINIVSEGIWLWATACCPLDETSIEEYDDEKIKEGIASINELRNIGLLDEAFSSIRELIFVCPDSPELLNIEGELNFQSGQTEEAKKSFLALIEKFPEYGQALNNLGVVYLNEGNLDKALYYYKKALDANPDDISATLNLADLLVTLAKCKESESLLSSFLERNPEAEQVSFILNNLKEKFSLNKKEAKFKVSAIVSTYNSEKFIRGCLEDLINQTLYAKKELEIIVVDTGSQQNEEIIVKGFQKEYEHIHYIRTEHRETIYQAWNRGIKASSGKYITNANTDDRHRPDGLEWLAYALDIYPDVGIVYADSLITKTDNDTWSEKNVTGIFRWPDHDRRLLFDVCYIGPQPVWRHDLHIKYGYFDETYSSAGDYEFWLRLSEAGVPILHIKDMLGLYLENVNSIVLANTDLNWQESERARDRHWPEKPGVRPATKWINFAKPLTHADINYLNRKKLLLCCDYFWPSIGGVELYVEDLALHLKASGFNVDIACRYLPERNVCEYRGLRIHQFNCEGCVIRGKVRGDFYLFQKLITKEGYDSVLLLTQPDNWLGISLIDLSDPHPEIILMPSINKENIIDWKNNGIIHRIVEILRAADKLISVTENGEDRKFMIEYGLKSTFIPHAVSRNGFSENFRNIYGLSHDRPLLVMVANFWPVKNHIELLKILQNTEGDWQLVIIGHPISHLLNYYNSVVEQAGKDKRVLLINGLPREHASAAIRDAELLLVPSKGESAGPLVVLQAMSYGTPWIATPECNAVRDEAGGIVVSLNKFPEIINYLLNHEEDRITLGKLGEKHWRHSFCWLRTFSSFISLIYNVPSVIDLKMSSELRNDINIIQEKIIEDRLPVDFSVVIPTYNRSAILKKCLDALSEQTFPSNRFEVIICDDGSTDNTEELIKEYSSPFKLTYLKQENRGPASARNMGIEKSNGIYLLILNDDAMLDRNAIMLHSEKQKLHRGKKIAILGDFSLLPEYISSPFGYILEHTDVLFDYANMKPGYKYDFNHFYTCNISIEKRAVLEAGMFDLDFTGPAAEDLELGYRLEKKGYKVIYEPQIIAWHDHYQTPENFCSVNKIRGRGAVTLMIKHPGLSIFSHINRNIIEEWKILNSNLTLKIKETLQYLIDIDGRKYENTESQDFINIINKIFPLVKFLQSYYWREGFLGSPELEHLIKIISRKSLVSVVITCYNYASYLPESLESVIKQTYQDFDIIIVNDGSTDNTKEVAEKLIDKYASHNIRLINQPNSGQPAISRNNGIAEAKGTYILCLDADDMLDPLMLEECIRLLQNNINVSIAYTDRLDFDGVDSIVPAGDYDFSKLRYANQISYCALYKKEVWEKIGGYRTNVRGVEDWDFWVAAGARGYFGKRIPKALFKYRRHDTGLYQEVLKDYNRKIAQIVLNNREVYTERDIAEAQMLLGNIPEKEGINEIMVSVIVPTYNRPDMIVNTLNSILNQTYQDFEVIVINDGGIEIEHIIKKLNRKKNITYIRLVKNMERSVARNAGVKIARGKYIAYLDDDDIFYPDHLKILVEFLETTDYKVAYTDAYKAYQNKQNNTYVVTKREIPYSFDFDSDRILVDNFIPILCIMHEKSCMEEVGFFNEKFTALEDMDLWIRMSRKFQFAHINKVTCEFSWRDDGTTTTTREPVKFRQTLPVIYNKYKEYTKNKLHLLQIQKKVVMNFKELVSVLPLPEQNIDSLFAAGELSITFDNTDDARFFYKKILEIEPYNNIAMEKLKSILKPSPVSIIILTFNQLEHTKICLESIKKHTPELHEIIIVDNGSTDGTPEYLKEYIKTCDNVIVIANSVNRGFSAGNNQGISIAKGEYILLLNNDTVVTEGWLRNMLSVLQIEPNVGITGPVTNNISGPQKITEAFYETLEEMEAFASKWTESHKGQTLNYPRVVGFCLLTRKSVIDLIGCLDERFATGNFEDDDFCVRAAQAGYGARIVMDSFVHHTGSQTFKGAKINYMERMMANWKLFKEKWGIPADATLEKGYTLSVNSADVARYYIPLPDVSTDHIVDENNKWWHDISLEKPHVKPVKKEDGRKPSAREKKKKDKKKKKK